VRRTVILFGHSSHDTSRDTARILTVHTLDLHKGGYQLIPFVNLARIVAVYHGEGPSVRPPLPVQYPCIIKGFIWRGKVINLVTGQLTFPTANTRGEVNRQAYGSPGSLGRRLA
jgi:hypothetical protein